MMMMIPRPDDDDDGTLEAQVLNISTILPNGPETLRVLISDGPVSLNNQRQCVKTKWTQTLKHWIQTASCRS